MKPDSSSTWRWRLKALFVILWAFFLAGGYVWAHNPVEVAVLRSMWETVTSIAIWLGVTWIGAALGHRILTGRLLWANELNGPRPATELALAAGIGLGFLSLIIWGMGMLGYFYPGAAWLVVFVLVIFLWGDMRSILRTARAVRLPTPDSALQLWFLVYCIAFFVLAFLIALAPPTAFDSLVYHLPGPQLYIESGQLGHPVDIPHLGFPQLGQMHFVLGMLLVGDGPAALFHFGYGLLAVAVTATLARDAFGTESAWFSTVILLSVPSVFWLMSQPYVDLTLLFYATAAFFAFHQWREWHARGQAATGWLIAIGLFSGFGGSVKYTAVLIPLALGLSLIWVSRRDGLSTIVQRVGTVALVAGAAVVPWVFENWLTTGNPIYPFFFDEALYWNEWRSWWYDRPGTGLATSAPWRLPLVPVEVAILSTQGSEMYDATIGPLLLLSAGLLTVIWPSLKHKEKGIIGHLLLFFSLNYLLWLAGLARTRLLMQARLIIFAFGIVAVLGGVALARISTLRRPQLAVDWLVRTVVAGILALILFSHLITFLEINPLPETLGLETKDQFLTRRQGLQWLSMKEVNQLPAEARVVFLWAARSYYCEVDCWPDAILDRFLRHTHYYGHNADQIADVWREQGFTHVLIHQAGLDFLLEAGNDPITAADLRILHELQESHLREVARWPDAYYLYELVDESRAHIAEER